MTVAWGWGDNKEERLGGGWGATEDIHNIKAQAARRFFPRQVEPSGIGPCNMLAGSRKAAVKSMRPTWTALVDVIWMTATAACGLVLGPWSSGKEVIECMRAIARVLDMP